MKDVRQVASLLARVYNDVYNFSQFAGYQVSMDKMMKLFEADDSRDVLHEIHALQRQLSNRGLILFIMPLFEKQHNFGITGTDKFPMGKLDKYIE